MIPFTIASELAIDLRPIAETEDLPLLFRIYAATRIDIWGYEPWTYEEKLRLIEEQFLIQHKAYMNGYDTPEFYIICRNGRDMGRLYLEQRPDDIRIIDIALLPEFRNNGVGTALLKDILACGRKTGRRVSIHVEKQNPALSLYQRLGFVKTNDIPFYDLMETPVG